MNQILKKLKKAGVIFFVSLFLLLNFYASQKISPIYFDLVENDKKNAIDFLKKIRKTNWFDSQLNYFVKIFGSSLKLEVFSEEIARTTKIKQLEQLLTKNNQSRDVLYSLFLLYLERGDKITTEKYLMKAKEVDPDIN